MNRGYTKLFSSLLTSSVWSCDDKVRIMWITMLVSADATGHVSGTIPGMAAMARMSLEDAERAIQVLEGTDAYSRTRTHEGRRLLPCDGGWCVTNYARYREMRDPAMRTEQNRQAQRRWRERNRKPETVSPRKPEISHGKPESAQASPEASPSPKEAALLSSEPSFRLSGLLLDLILARKPDFKRPKLERWAQVVDRMMRLDHRTPERIEAVIRWSQADDFWQNNILSAEKLRKQFDQLELKMKDRRDGQARQRGTPRQSFSGQTSAVGDVIEV
ncbi:MAG: hypothetical protein FJ224_12765 [Lentisphaerae bacterium]|nr:hypothetical protein [Lentisphaerota bacterium]